MLNHSKLPDKSDASTARSAKQEQGPSSQMADAQRQFGNAAVQTQSRGLSAGSVSGMAPMMRSGNAIPPGAVIEGVENANVDAVMGAVTAAGRQAAGGYGDRVDWATSPIQTAVESAFANNLASRVVRVNWQSPSRGFGGKAINWTGNISFRIGSATQINGGGTAGMTGNTGGSATTGTQNTTARTDGAELNAGAKAGDAKEGGEVSAGGKVSTSTTTTAQETGGTTSNSGGAMSGNRNMQRFSAPLSVSVSLTASPDFGGSDYINPWAWGQQAVLGYAFGSGSGSAECGTIKYYTSNGIAGSGP